MSEEGREARYWSAQSADRPQYRVQVMAMPRPGGRWTVKRARLLTVYDEVAVECANQAEAIGAARALMASARVIGDWS